MDPTSMFTDFANDWGPVWALLIMVVLMMAWLIREMFKLQRETLAERARARAVIERLIVAVRNLSERLKWSRER